MTSQTPYYLRDYLTPPGRRPEPEPPPQNRLAFPATVVALAVVWVAAAAVVRMVGGF